jgi:hypothetical protein
MLQNHTSPRSVLSHCAIYVLSNLSQSASLYNALVAVVSGTVAVSAKGWLGKAKVVPAGEDIIDKLIKKNVQKLRYATDCYLVLVASVLTTEFFWQSFMAELPELQTILKQFPWARTGKDGTFEYELELALRGFLRSGPKFGWWATEEPECYCIW